MYLSLSKISVMKAKNGFILVLIMCLFAGGLTGCIDKGDNIETFPGIPSYVTSSGATGSTMLSTNYPGTHSPIYVPILDGVSGVNYGDYCVVTYSINYDKQKESEKYYTVDQLYEYFPAPSSYAALSNDPLKDMYNDTIVNVVPYWTQMLNDKMIFMYVEEFNPASSIFECRLTWHADSTAKYQRPMFYLQATKSSAGTNYNSPFRTFDMTELISSSYARDTIISGQRHIVADFDLYYQTGTDKDDNPVFKAYDRNPVYVLR